MTYRFAFGLLLVLFLVGVIATPPSAYADRTLFTVSIPNNGGPNLRVVNPLNGATIATIPITLTGFSVLGSTGLARDPTTGKLWGLLRVSGATSCVAGSGGNIPQLVTINPGTGVATNVGSVGDCFSGLAFSSNGTLYGVTGDGANTPATLYTLNKSTAAPTLAKALGNGDFGEAIGFNPTDGLIYHASGFDDRVFESINPANLAAAPVNIARSGFDDNEVLGITHSHGNTLLLTNGGCPLTPCPGLLTITTSGVATSLGVMDHDAKGLAFTPKPPADFERDLKNDIAIFRDGLWYYFLSSNGALVTAGLGTAGDLPVAADYDGDGITDRAIFRNGIWYHIQSSNGALVQTGLGTAGDVAVPGDYDGDGKADQAIFRNGIWYNWQSSNGALVQVGLGTVGDVAVPGDYDGDGKTDRAIFRNGIWYYFQSSNGVLVQVGLGTAGDLAVPADYDGDGKADPSIVRNGIWYILQSSNGALIQVGLGTAGDIAVPADYDGDGRVDQAIYRNGVWWIRQSSDGQVVSRGLGGLPQDIPVN